MTKDKIDALKGGWKSVGRHSTEGAAKEKMSLRQMQKEAARALGTMSATNNNISKFNKLAHHDSQNWYLAVVQWYIDEYGDLPSKTGPGKDVILLHDV
tara:strand:- start:790 stop:1083 length:294 start_codon:yes stop_codon:yes gene_type:complete